MKYRPTEQVIVDAMNKEIDKINLKMEKMERAKRIMISRHDARINDVADKAVVCLDRIRRIDNRVKKRCKHMCERRYWANMRDDASFERYCACVDCDEIIWDECK